VKLAKMLQMQLKQQPPDIRYACPAIDSEFAGFIDSALCKEPDQRISDWMKIREILQVPHRLDLILDPDELAVVIRFRDTPAQRSEQLIKAIQQMLQDEDINYKIETQRGDDA
jgi:hypothetical protein